MTRSYAGIWIIIGALLCSPVATAAESQDARIDKMLNAVDDLYRGESSSGKMTMTVVTRHWKRTLQMEFHNKGTDRALVRILAPRKEKGTTTLRVKKDMWNYLPKTDRIIKVPVSMMGGSWMGSHFTNDDLVRQSRMADDFTYTLSFEGDRNGAKVSEVTCIAKEDAVVVWGKVIVEVKNIRYSITSLIFTRFYIYKIFRSLALVDYICLQTHLPH